MSKTVAEDFELGWDRVSIVWVVFMVWRGGAEVEPFALCVEGD